MQINNVGFKGQIYQFPRTSGPVCVYDSSIKLVKPQEEEDLLGTTLDRLASCNHLTTSKRIKNKDGSFHYETSIYNEKTGSFDKDVKIFDKEGDLIKHVTAQHGKDTLVHEYDAGVETVCASYRKGSLVNATIRNEKGEVQRIIEKHPKVTNRYIVSDFDNENDTVLVRAGKLNSNFFTAKIKDVDIKGAPVYISFDSNDYSWQLENNSPEDALKAVFSYTEGDKSGVIEMDAPFDDTKPAFVTLKTQGKTIGIQQDSTGRILYTKNISKKEVRELAQCVESLSQLFTKYNIRYE